MDGMTSECGRVPGPAEMADRLAILDVLARHCRGVDRADQAVLTSCYWPDATVAYGGFNGNAHRFCAILPSAIRAYARTRHAISNTLFEFAGDVACVETYVMACHYRAVEDGPDTEMTFLGRYLDRLQKRGDVWKILHRQVVMDWNRNTDASAIRNWPPFDGLARGARYPDDPLYALLAAP